MSTPEEISETEAPNSPHRTIAIALGVLIEACNESPTLARRLGNALGPEAFNVDGVTDLKQLEAAQQFARALEDNPAA